MLPAAAVFSPPLAVNQLSVGAQQAHSRLEEPLRQIVSNAGGEPSVVVSRVREGKDDFGYNALTGTYEDLVKSGVIDPTKVVRSALQNAASVASLLITTEAAIATKPEKKAGAPAGGDDAGYDEDY